MMVSKTISIKAEELLKISELVEQGKVSNISEFFQKATEMYLKSIKD